MPEYVTIMLRCIYAYIFLFIICRILGKRQISQLTFFDYVVGIAIGSVTASLSIDTNKTWVEGTVGLATWGILPMVITLISLFFRPFRRIVDGSPSVLIENGKILEKNLLKSRISLDELMIQLRQKNAFQLSDVELAVFETNGKLSVMKKTDQTPVTPSQLGLVIEKTKSPSLVIDQGKIIEKGLEESGFSKEWLKGELGKKGILTLKDVYAAQVDSKGQLYIDYKDDQKQQSASTERQAVLAKLKKIGADLDLYALDTENKRAKQLYKDESKVIKNLQHALEPYLK